MKIISKTDIKDMKIIIKDYESSPTSMITTSSSKLNFHTLSTYCNLCEQKSIFFDNYNTQEVFNNEKLDVMKNVYNSLIKIETQGQNQSITKNSDISDDIPTNKQKISVSNSNLSKNIIISNDSNATKNKSEFSSLDQAIIIPPQMFLENIPRSLETVKSNYKLCKNKSSIVLIKDLRANLMVNLNNYPVQNQNIEKIYISNMCKMLKSLDIIPPNMENSEFLNSNIMVNMIDENNETEFYSSLYDIYIPNEVIFYGPELNPKNDNIFVIKSSSYNQTSDEFNPDELETMKTEKKQEIKAKEEKIIESGNQPLKTIDPLKPIFCNLLLTDFANYFKKKTLLRNDFTEADTSSCISQFNLKRDTLKSLENKKNTIDTIFFILYLRELVESQIVNFNLAVHSILKFIFPFRLKDGKMKDNVLFEKLQDMKINIYETSDAYNICTNILSRVEDDIKNQIRKGPNSEELLTLSFYGINLNSVLIFDDIRQTKIIIINQLKEYNKTQSISKSYKELAAKNNLNCYVMDISQLFSLSLDLFNASILNINFEQIRNMKTTPALEKTLNEFVSVNENSVNMLEIDLPKIPVKSSEAPLDEKKNIEIFSNITSNKTVDNNKKSDFEEEEEITEEKVYVINPSDLTVDKTDKNISLPSTIDITTTKKINHFSDIRFKEYISYIKSHFVQDKELIKKAEIMNLTKQINSKELMDLINKGKESVDMILFHFYLVRLASILKDLSYIELLYFLMTILYNNVVIKNDESTNEDIEEIFENSCLNINILMYFSSEDACLEILNKYGEYMESDIYIKRIEKLDFLSSNESKNENKNEIVKKWTNYVKNVFTIIKKKTIDDKKSPTSKTYNFINDDIILFTYTQDIIPRLAESIKNNDIKTIKEEGLKVGIYSDDLQSYQTITLRPKAIDKKLQNRVSLLAQNIMERVDEKYQKVDQIDQILTFTGVKLEYFAELVKYYAISKNIVMSPSDLTKSMELNFDLSEIIFLEQRKCKMDTVMFHFYLAYMLQSKNLQYIDAIILLMQYLFPQAKEDINASSQKFLLDKLKFNLLDFSQNYFYLSTEEACKAIFKYYLNQITSENSLMYTDFDQFKSVNFSGNEKEIISKIEKYKIMLRVLFDKMYESLGIKDTTGEFQYFKNLTKAEIFHNLVDGIAESTKICLKYIEGKDDKFDEYINSIAINGIAMGENSTVKSLAAKFNIRQNNVAFIDKSDDKLIISKAWNLCLSGISLQEFANYTHCRVKKQKMDSITDENVKEMEELEKTSPVFQSLNTNKNEIDFVVFFLYLKEIFKEKNHIKFGFTVQSVLKFLFPINDRKEIDQSFIGYFESKLDALKIKYPDIHSKSPIIVSSNAIIENYLNDSTFENLNKIFSENLSNQYSFTGDNDEMIAKIMSFHQYKFFISKLVIDVCQNVTLSPQFANFDILSDEYKNEHTRTFIKIINSTLKNANLVFKKIENGTYIESENIPVYSYGAIRFREKMDLPIIPIQPATAATENLYPKKNASKIPLLVIGGQKPPKSNEIYDVVYNGDKILQTRNYSGFSSLKNRVLFGPLLILEHISIGFTKKSVKTENKSIKTYKHNEKERCAKIISLYARSGIDLENIKDVEYNIVDLYNHLYDKNVEEITDMFKIIRTAKENNVENPSKFYLIDKYNNVEKVITFKDRPFVFYSNYELKLKKIKNEPTNVLMLKSIYKITDEWITIYAANLLIKKMNAAKLIETEAAEKMSNNLLSKELSSEEIINNAESLNSEEKFNLEINKVISKGDEKINKVMEDYVQQLLNEKIDTKSEVIAQIDDTNKQIPTIVKFKNGVDVYKENSKQNLNLNDTATKKKAQSNRSNYNYELDFNIKYQPFIYDNEDMPGKNSTEKNKFMCDIPDTNLMFNNKLVISTSNSKETKLLGNNNITSESVKNEGETEKEVKSETETEAEENITLKLIEYSCLQDDSKTPVNTMPFFRPFMTPNDMKKLRKAQRGDFILTLENGQLMICISINKKLTISTKIIRSNEKYMLFQNPELFNTIKELLSYYTKNDMHFKGKLA